MRPPEQQPAEQDDLPLVGAATHSVSIRMLVAAALAVVTLAVFWPVTGYDFIGYDDTDYVTRNAQVQAGLTWKGVVWALEAGRASNWHPLTWISHMLDAQLFGPGPVGPHLVNLFFHAANSALVFVVLARLTGALWRSALVAALFGLHPLHVESVAWVSERKDVLSTFFWLWALWAYERYVVGVTSDKGRATGRESITSSVVSPVIRHSSLFYSLALLFFALGLMSKPMLVTLPFVMLLLDYWPLRRFELSTLNSQPSTLWRLVREKIPFFALSVISSGVTFVAQRKGGAVQTLGQLSVVERLENGLVSYARYLGKAFWPEKLAIIYPRPDHWPLVALALAGALVLGLSLSVLWLGRRLPFMPTGWFWFLGTLVPVIGLVQVGEQSMADRYTYVPLIGVFLLLVWGAGEACVRWRLPGALAGVAAGLVVVACAVRTRDQLHYWQNGGSLFRHAIAVTEKNYGAYNNLGGFYEDLGQIDAAISNYRAAIDINPSHAVTHYNLATALAKKGRLAEAIQHYTEALRLDPGDAVAHNNLGFAFTSSGRFDEAIQQYLEALRVDPNYADAHYNLGVALANRGRLDWAIQHFSEALRLDPKNTKACSHLGNTWLRKGRVEEAENCYRKALQIDPNDTVTLNNLGGALAEQGRFDEALSRFQQSLRIDPGNPEVHFNLGRVLARLGRRDEAIAHLKEAVRLKPDYGEAKQQLSALGVQTTE